MRKHRVKYRRKVVQTSVLSFILKKRVADEDESVPFLHKNDLYRDKVAGAATH